MLSLLSPLSSRSLRYPQPLCREEDTAREREKERERERERETERGREGKKGGVRERPVQAQDADNLYCQISKHHKQRLRRHHLQRRLPNPRRV
jgi:hypothetical protein